MNTKSSELRRIVIQFALLVVLQWALAELLSHYPLLEHILSPGKDSAFALVVVGLFMALRMFLLLFGVGWLLARLWLWFTRPKKFDHAAVTD